MAQGGQPAELPPQSYRGMQYVDSEGCAFLRAGTEQETLWVPRVNAGGKQLCGFPPSGNRVPVQGEPGAGEVATEANPPRDETDTKAEGEVGAGAQPDDTASDFQGYLVAVGSFGFASNVEKAASGVRALGYPAIKGKVSAGEQGLVTVFAGPFGSAADAEDARAKIRAAGFPDAIVMRY
ncbi:MAG TPA: SPOR domain-containing protein [Tabrizicola sp.]|nr:SPOR domain-containing protein [Tabrizicola sp.]